MKIQIINSTPFVPLQFESIDAKLNHFGVVVTRGTFEIVNRMPLQLSKKQDPLVLEDEYYGDPESSSLRFPSSLTPYKPTTDVLVEATSYSPSGNPEQSWVAEIRAGDLTKQFHVTGPRTVKKSFGINRLSNIEPISQLDIRYEHAFGGSETGSRARCESNPVGVGFDQKRTDWQCPQILPIDVQDPISKRVSPVGLGPIAPSWAQRISRSGTYDRKWKATKAPYLPDDFSFEFYNNASPGLTFPGFANGDEEFELINLSRDGNLSFSLPKIELMSIIQFADGRIIPGPVNLDTIGIQVEDKKVHLEWRGIFPVHIPIKKIEIRMSAPHDMIES